MTKGSAPKAQRHNERENKVYQNINVDSSMSHLNYHYKSPEGKSYNERFDELVEQKIISTRGLKEDATHFDEIIFDVNTRYFEDRGGYEFAKKFYQEAYEFVKEKYGEDKIISAVMHADELNEGVTAELEKPVYHYHLHVVAIPTVRKEILYSKRCKEVELRGTVKEVITQVSHSKMWESKPKLDEKGEPILSASGKPVIEKSYSRLQDDFYNHMVNAGEQRLVTKTTLPIPRESFVKQMEMKKFEKDLYFDFREHIDDKYEGAIEFEPDTRHCLIYLEAEYLRTDVYFALVDSAAAEQGARRTAMKSATDNATEMIATLTRIYNRERQGAITTEISEIVGGAAALEE